MSWKIFSKGSIPRPRRKKTGFTLVELLAVVAIMVLMMAFVGPAVSGIKGGRDIISNAYGIAGALEQARTYAMANNTYTWVGFFEENGRTPSTTGSAVSGTGQVVVGIFASKDGTRYTSETSTTVVTPSPGNLSVVGKVQKFNGLHLSDSDQQNLGPQVGRASYQVATMTSPGPKVRYPLAGTLRYEFSKIIEFNPQGEASPVADSLVSAPQKWLGIGLQAARGDTVDPKHQASVMVEGLTGRVHIFKP